MTLPPPLTPRRRHRPGLELASYSRHEYALPWYEEISGPPHLSPGQGQKAQLEHLLPWESGKEAGKVQKREMHQYTVNSLKVQNAAYENSKNAESSLAVQNAVCEYSMRMP